MVQQVYGVHVSRRTRALRTYVRTFQALSWLVVAAYLGQAVLAGQFLSGSYPALNWHGTGGTVSDTIVLVAVVVAALLRWHGKGQVWPFWASLGLLAANQVQNAAGAGRLINLHIPLGVAMLGIAVGVALIASQAGRLTASSVEPPGVGKPSPVDSEAANSRTGSA